MGLDVSLLYNCVFVCALAYNNLYTVFSIICNKRLTLQIVFLENMLSNKLLVRSFGGPSSSSSLLMPPERIFQVVKKKIKLKLFSFCPEVKQGDRRSNTAVIKAFLQCNHKGARLF